MQPHDWSCVATWQSAVRRTACLLPIPPPALPSIFRFPFAEAAAAVINRVVMRCQIRIMYVASVGHGHKPQSNFQPRSRLPQPAILQLLCSTATRQRHAARGTWRVEQAEPFAVFHVRRQRIFFRPKIGSTSVQCRRYSTIFSMARVLGVVVDEPESWLNFIEFSLGIVVVYVSQ